MLRLKITTLLFALATGALVIRLDAQTRTDGPNCAVTRSGFLGSEGLWVDLRYSPWHGVPVPGGFRVKFPWFSKDLGPADVQHPELSVTGRRLDADSPPLKLEGPNLACASRGSLSDPGKGNCALTSAMIFPTTGCWEITAKRKQAQVQFVVLLAPPNSLDAPDQSQRH